jgi:hypothetical protein
MYSIVLETPEFIEKQCSFKTLDRAQKMFSLMKEDTEEADFTLYIVEHNEEEDPTDLIEEDRGIITRYSEANYDKEPTPFDIIKEVKKSFKPLGMRGQYYNLVDVNITNDMIFCHLQSRVNSELFVDIGAKIVKDNSITFSPIRNHRFYRIYNGHETSMVCSLDDLKILMDMVKYGIDMLENTEIEL